VIVVLIAAAVVRLADLSEWWLNPDEGIYYSILTRADFSGFWQEVTANAHPPLYYLLLRGLGVFTWDFFWLRVFSVVCGLAAVLGVWAVARRLGGDGSRGAVAGLVAGVVLAFAPGPIELSQVMRPYMLQLALLAWALYHLLGYRRSASGLELVSYVTLATLALLVHYSSVLALAVFGLLVLTDGMEARFASLSWRRLMVAHAVPATVVLGLYFFHLRPLAASALADDALDGWLSFYMIGSPPEAWFSFLGFQHLLAGPWLRGPMALALLVAIGAAVWTRETGVAVLAGGALLVAVLAAGLGLYPFGSTRHSVWLLAFTVPTMGWLAANLLDARPGRRAIQVGLPLLLIGLGGPVGTVMGLARAPWSPSDRVLRQDDLGSMVDVLDPAAGPQPIFMSAQTFYLLMPFYALEREQAVFSPDSTVFRFDYGARTVLVGVAWDFTLATTNESPDQLDPPLADGPRAGPRGAGSGDLASVLRSASSAFPALDPKRHERGLILVGGWRPAFVDELQMLAGRAPILSSRRSVPGLYAFVIDGPALAASLGL